ncbi:MAG: EAL domain-containing protein [Gammaproteobacteria bacterium]|nr:MAG: EAL domain-containing protein [Gammaproteobacteria bacterium]
MTTAALLPLLQNAALLMAMALIYDIIVHNRARRGLAGDIVTGLAMGFIALAVMLTPFQLAPGIGIDPRSVLVSLVGLFFGLVPTLITVLMAATVRLFQGGFGAWTGVWLLLSSAAIGLLWRHFRSNSLTDIHWAELFGLGVVVHLVMLFLGLTLPDGISRQVLNTISLPALTLYPAATVALGCLMVKRLKQEQTATTLKANEERLRLALSAANLGLADINLKTGHMIVNDGYANILGTAPANFQETVNSAIKRIHPEDREAVLNAYRHYLSQCDNAQSGELFREFRVQAGNGDWRWVASLNKLVDWGEDGRPRRLLTTLTDITPRKEAEQTLERAHQEAKFLLNESTKARLTLLSALEDHQQATQALRESETSLAEVGRIARVGGWEMDVTSRQVILTPQSYKNFGVPPTVALSQENLLDLIADSDREKVATALREVVAKGTPFDLAVQLPDSRSGPQWMRFIGQAIWNDGRISRVQGTVQDITERKRAEQRQKQSYDLLMKLAAQVPSMLFQLQRAPDGAMFFPWCSSAIEHIYEIDADAFDGDAERLLERTHPDDRMTLLSAIESSAQTLEPFHCEYRVVLPRRGIQWRLSEAAPEKLPDGSVLWHGIISDITERKETEEALRLAGLVFQNSTEGMLIADADTTIVDANRAFTDMTGFSREEVIGKKPSVLQSGRQTEEFYRDMWAELNSSGHWQGELYNRRKNGEIYPEWLVINAVYGPDGEVHRWVAQFSDITEQKKNEQLIWQQANFDALTDLPNRRMFYDRLNQEIKKSQRSGHSLALLFIDLDHFKEINDTLGHETGDQLLKEAASRIRACIRESDTVARLGGDEFIIILSGLDENTTLERIIGALLGTLSEPYKLGSEEAFLSASIGVTLCPDDAGDIDSLMKNADQAMYAAKQQGRNGFQYFTPYMQQRAQRRMRIISDLRIALTSEQLWVAYQPIVTLATGQTLKAEALIRWNHPSEGPIGPDTFIPIAEETGLIHPISDYLFEEVARLALELRRDYNPHFQISVNISPSQLQRRDKSVYDAWHNYMQTRNLPGTSLVLEITEGLLLDHRPVVTEQLIAFRDAGIQVALDDFGTGYSSLSYLKKFDIDYLKIDKSFVDNLAAGNDDMVLCEAIVVMAHKLGIEVIAEGVETELQRDLLLAAGCDYAQGYLFSRPIDSRHLKDFLLQSAAPGDLNRRA